MLTPEQQYWMHDPASHKYIYIYVICVCVCVCVCVCSVVLYNHLQSKNKDILLKVQEGLPACKAYSVYNAVELFIKYIHCFKK